MVFVLLHLEKEEQKQSYSESWSLEIATLEAQ